MHRYRQICLMFTVMECCCFRSCGRCPRLPDSSQLVPAQPVICGAGFVVSCVARLRWWLREFKAACGEGRRMHVELLPLLYAARSQGSRLPNNVQTMLLEYLDRVIAYSCIERCAHR